MCQNFGWVVNFVPFFILVLVRKQHFVLETIILRHGGRKPLLCDAVWLEKTKLSKHDKRLGLTLRLPTVTCNLMEQFKRGWSQSVGGKGFKSKLVGMKWLRGGRSNEQSSIGNFGSASCCHSLILDFSIS